MVDKYSLTLRCMLLSKIWMSFATKLLLATDWVTIGWMFDSIDKIMKINTLIFILYFRLSIKYEEYIIQRIVFFLFQNCVVLIEKNENEKNKNLRLRLFRQRRKEYNMEIFNDFRI